MKDQARRCNGPALLIDSHRLISRYNHAYRFRSLFYKAVSLSLDPFSVSLEALRSNTVSSIFSATGGMRLLPSQYRTAGSKGTQETHQSREELSPKSTGSPSNRETTRSQWRTITNGKQSSRKGRDPRDARVPNYLWDSITPVVPFYYPTGLESDEMEGA